MIKIVLNAEWIIKESKKKKKNSSKIIPLVKKISKSLRNVHDLDPNPDPDMDLDLDLFFPVQIKEILSTDFQKDISHCTKVDT